MAISIASSQGLGEFDITRDYKTLTERLRLAVDGNKSYARQIADEPDFTVDLVATTDTSDGEAVDLTDQGVTFPADTVRTIRCVSHCSSPNDHFWEEWEEDVLGGTTPVLMGKKVLKGGADQAGTVFEYGDDLKFVATITALTTIDTIFASKGYSMGDITAGLAALVVPRNRAFLPKGAVLTTPSVVSATIGLGEQVIMDPTNLDGLGSGTAGVAFVSVDVAGTAIVAASPALGGQVCLAFACYAPINHRLVMDSNNVTVKCTATNANVADDSLRHRVEIRVGKLRQLQHTS